MPEGPTLAELGEEELIRRLGAFASPGQFDDDAALLPAGLPQAQLVINTDVLVEEVHFSEATTGPGDVGWRAAAANLSDLAAMGCSRVVGLTVGLVAPGGTPWRWVEGVYQGMAEVLGVHGGVLLGGDCSGGTQTVLAVTALGLLPSVGGGPIRRRDGRAGDVLVSTGPHGLSRLGLALLKQNQTLPPLPAELRARAVTAHRRPRPRLDAVKALAQSLPLDHSWRVGGCDSSDGLVAAVVAVAAASGCGAVLERDRLPLEPAMASLPQGVDWCLSGGEDFELVLALAPAWAERLVERLPGAAPIGALVEAAGPERLHWAGSGEPLRSGADAFSHFR